VDAPRKHGPFDTRWQPRLTVVPRDPSAPAERESVEAGVQRLMAALAARNQRAHRPFGV